MFAGGDSIAKWKGKGGESGKGKRKGVLGMSSFVSVSVLRKGLDQVLERAYGTDTEGEGKGASRRIIQDKFKLLIATTKTVDQERALFDRSVDSCTSSSLRPLGLGSEK